MEHEPGGYDTRGASLYSKSGKELSEPERDALTCPCCLFILREPKQIIVCGHRICTSCTKQIIRKRPLQCPVDGDPISEEDIKIDRGCLKEINSLLVDCPAKVNGCNWRSLLIKLEEHLEVCLYTFKHCKHCKQSIPNKELVSHETESCSQRPTHCSYCNEIVPMDALDDHLKNCLYIPIVCELCGDKVSKALMSDHKTDDCPEATVKCVFCSFEGKLLVVNEHYSTRHAHKMAKLSITMPKLLESVKKLEIEPARGLVEMDSGYSSSGGHDRKGVASPVPIGPPSSSVFSSSSSSSSNSYLSSAKSSSFNSSSTSGVSAVSESMLEVKSLFPVVQKLQENVDEIKSVQEDHKKQLDKQLHQIATISESSQAVQESVSRHAVTMEDIKLRQDILDVKATGGVFIWKIPDIKRRYKDALERRTLSLYSPPFHSSPHGYRMCIRAYLNGDGSGKNSHISVFFVLMRSEHDNLLPWPFRQAVTFQLINQENQSKGISETFLPDLQSPSFQKPHSEMNIASGFPRFVDQKILKDENFTKGNAIFIKCKVDLGGLILE